MHGTCSSKSMSFLDWGNQKWIKQSGVSHQCWVERRITSLDLLFLMQPKMPQGCFAGSWSVVVHQNPQVHFYRAAFMCVSASGCTFPGAGLCILPCWTTWNFCQPVSAACWGPCKWQNKHLVYHLQTCWGLSLSITHIISEWYWPCCQPLDAHH